MNSVPRFLIRLLPAFAVLLICASATASSLQLTMYSGSYRQTLVVDSTYGIIWYASEPTAVRLEYSVDSGRTWRYIDTATAGAFEYRWIVPRVRTTLGKFRVSTLDGSVSDVSAGLFTIDTSSLSATYPNSGGRFAVGSTLTLQWWGANLVGTVDVDVSLDSMHSWRNIASKLPAQNGRNSLDWNVGPDTADAAFFRVSVPAQNLSDTCNAPFKIVVPRLHLIAPVGGNLVQPRDSIPALWTYSGPSGWLRFELSIDGGATWPWVTNREAREGRDSMIWLVPRTRSHRALLRLGMPGIIYDTIAAPFAIGSWDSCSIEALAPASGDRVVVDSLVTIRWRTTGFAGSSVQVLVSTDGGYAYETIADHQVTADGEDSTTWRAAKWELDAVVRIRDRDGVITTVITPIQVRWRPTGIALEPSMESSRLTAEPNPVCDRIVLRWPGSAPGVLSIVSSDGRVCLRRNGVRSGELIDVSALVAGAYLCRVDTGSETRSAWIVVQ